MSTLARKPSHQRQARDHGDGVFPIRYAESITSRAVATSNSCPDERRTKAVKGIVRPRFYDAAKQRESNLSGLRGRLRFMSTLDCQMHPGAIKDMLPYLKFFDGGAPGSRPSAFEGLDGADGAEAASTAAAVSKAVLMADDIDEF